MKIWSESESKGYSYYKAVTSKGYSYYMRKFRKFCGSRDSSLVRWWWLVISIHIVIMNLTLVCTSKLYFSQRKDEETRVGLPCNHQIEILYGKASDDKSPLGIDKAVEICKCLRGWIRSDRRSVDSDTYVIILGVIYNFWAIAGEIYNHYS